MPWQDERSAWQSHMRVERDSKTGIYRSTIAIHDQNRLVSGQWASVIEDFADPSGMAAMAHACATMRRHSIYLGEDGTRRWCPGANPDQYLELGPPEFWTGAEWHRLALGQSTRLANSVSWETDDYRLLYVSTWSGLQMQFTLKTDRAATRFRWPVTLRNLEWKDWRLSAGGQALGAVVKPAIMDHAGLPRPTDDVPREWTERELDTAYSRGYIEAVADVEGLQYPILIANTDITIQADTNGKDTYTTTNLDKHYGSATKLGGAAGYIIQMLFDASGIDGGDTCSSATLSLWNISTSGSTKTSAFYSILEANDGWNVGATAEPGTGYATHGHHTEDTQEWEGGENGCFVSGTDRSAVSIGSVSHVDGDGQDTECEGALTAGVVETWFGDPNSNYGIVGDVTDSKPEWRSSNYTTAAHRPKLVIIHQAAAGNPWYVYAQMQ